MASTRRALVAGGLALAAAGGGFLGWHAWARQRGARRPVVRIGDGVAGPRDMAWVPGGVFLMGSDHALARHDERPAHSVRVHGFWMDLTHVTNDQFAGFVRATGYVTTAERKPDWETVRVQLPQVDL